jgi:uncharacterized protein YdcH (DUF465 family)
MSTLKSLNNHLAVLKEKHNLLDKKTSEEYKNFLNNDEYTKHKKEKLKVKDEIVFLEKIIELKEKESNEEV